MSTQQPPRQKKMLNAFSITMMSVIAVDSLRTLPFSATYGFSLVFFYAIAAFGYLLPIGLVASELASGWPNRGGIYVWVKEAFGDFAGLSVIWLQWLYNLIWYPTILAFLSGTTAYLFYPGLVENKLFMTTTTLLIFWVTTAVNWYGLTASNWLGHYGAVFGTLLPMFFIILLSVIWLATGHTPAIPMSFNDIFPDFSNTGNLPYFLAVLFGLVGLEISAIHADGVEEPEKSYPQGFLMAGIIIFFSLVLSSLAIAIVVPPNELNVVAGLTQAFEYFFDTFGLFWMKPVIIFLIIFGGMACMSTWILGPTRALLVAAQHGNLPPIFAKMNMHNAPVTLLIIQLVVGSVLSLMFLLLPTVNSSYWFLSVITSQLAMIVYIMLFAAAFKLKLHQPHVKRHYEVPGGIIGMFIVSMIGITTCLGAIFIGFIPPNDMPFDEKTFCLWVGTGMVCAMLPLFFLYRKSTL